MAYRMPSDQRRSGRGLALARIRREMQPTLLVLEDRRMLSTVVVNSPLDNVNDAVITGPTVTLREAINYENANGGGSITFDPTAFSTPQTIDLTIRPARADDAVRRRSRARRGV